MSAVFGPTNFVTFYIKFWCRLMDGQEEDADVDMAEASSLSRLDSCTVQVDPPMTETMEHLRMPENLMNQLHIVAAVTPTGLVLTGEKTELYYASTKRDW